MQVDSTSDVISNGLKVEFGSKPKSQIRHLFEKVYPEAFIKGKEGLYSVIFLDTLQILKEIGNGSWACPLPSETRKRPTCKDLVIAIKRSAEYYLSNTECSIFVLFYDKIEKVALSKGETQETRDDTKKSIEKNAKTLDDNEFDATRREIETYMLEEQVKYNSLEMDVCKTALSTDVNRKNYSPTDQKSFKEKRPYMSLESYIPEDWMLAMTDREDTTRHIIAWITYQMFFSEDQECQVDVPPGKTFMVDGHCLGLTDRGDGNLFQEPMLDILRIQDPEMYRTLFECFPTESKMDRHLMERINFMPLVKYTTSGIFPDGSYGAPEQVNYFDVNLYNEHGEADFNFFFYVKALSNLPHLQLTDFCIYSIDTDILSFSLWKFKEYLGQGAKHQKLYWKFKPSPSVFLFCRFPKCSTSEMVDINALYYLMRGEKQVSNLSTLVDYDEVFKARFKRGPADIQREDAPKYRKFGKKITVHVDGDDAVNDPDSKKKKSEVDWISIRKSIARMRYPEKNMVAAMLCGGSDYTKGYNRITYERIFIAMAHHYDFIQDLVRVSTYTDHDYQNAFFEDVELDGAAYSRLIMCSFMHAHKTNFEEKKSTPGDIPQIRPSKHNYKQIKEKTKKLAPCNQVPTPHFIAASSLHLCYYIMMMNNLGSYSTPEPDLSTFCFGKKRESIGWVRKNVQKMFTSECISKVIPLK